MEAMFLGADRVTGTLSPAFSADGGWMLSV